MRMIKKYWWLIAIAIFAYFKWDMVSEMLGLNKDKVPAPKPVNPEYGPMNLPTTEKPFQEDSDGNQIPDYLQA